MAINYRLKYITANGQLHGPFNTPREAHEYAWLTRLQGYEIVDQDTAQKISTEEDFDRLHRRLTKS